MTKKLRTPRPPVPFTLASRVLTTVQKLRANEVIVPTTFALRYAAQRVEPRPRLEAA